MTGPRLFFVSCVGAILVSFVALRLGAVTDLSWDAILALRLPRVVLGFAVGAGLSVAGLLLQTLFSNTVVDPYTLGVSSGSALGALLGAALGLPMVLSGLAVSGFLGALVFTAILVAFSRRPGVTSTAVLLAGVSLGFLGSSGVAVIMATVDVSGLQGALVWLLGDLSRVSLAGAIGVFCVVTSVSGVAWTRWTALDALYLGESGALSLGFPVPKIRTQLIVLVSLVVSVCVSAAGMIGFLGLIVPHWVRLVRPGSHARILPLTFVWGGIALVVADAVARVLVAPVELPAGVVTALVGAPVFFFLMVRRPMGRSP